ncbi:MAG: HugZ family protein [Pseudolabrys sp.]
MTPDTAYDAVKTGKKLLREARSGALATLIPGAGDPYCSLVNVATASDAAPLLLLSRLALHTKNIAADPRASLMLDERKDGDPLEGARIMLMGALTTTDDALARNRYLARHPDAYMFAGFGDFAFYRMEIARVHLVAGFGRIDDLKPRDLLTDVSDATELAAAEAGVITHMNNDHVDALRLYATKLLGAADGAWRCVGCDPEGLDIQLGRVALRLPFLERVSAPGPLRKILVELAEQARAI